jgi:hypothetical protein
LHHSFHSYSRAYSCELFISLRRTKIFGTQIQRNTSEESTVREIGQKRGCPLKGHHLDILRDDYSPKTAALDFLYELATHRSKKHLFAFVEYVIGKLNAYQQAGANGNFQEKYAALTAFNTLAAKLKQIPVRLLTEGRMNRILMLLTGVLC